jgi:hypothetical protein
MYFDKAEKMSLLGTIYVHSLIYQKPHLKQVLAKKN